MIRRLVVLWSCAIMAGCASAPAAVVTRTVDLPVAVRCAPDLGAEPDYPDTDVALRAAPDLFSRVQLLVAGRLLRMARDAEKSAARAQCAG